MAEQSNIPLKIKPQKNVIAFARHETFHPRFGWLKKGFDRASADSEIFLRKDSPVRLGVGKNMVRSIRYWCGAFKLLENDQPTAFGRQLIGLEGWDPYLEDPASLWLLHWKLLEPTCVATAWYYTFNQFQRNEFTVEDLFYQVCELRDRDANRIADSSIKKDINCLLRMYVAQATKSSMSEDSIDCPFVDLGLIHTAGDSRHYTFRFGDKPSLPAEIVVYACLSFAAYLSETARSIPLSKLLYEVGSPGLVFKLTESSLCAAIEAIAQRDHRVSLEESAGLVQMAFDLAPIQLADEILDSYYAVLGENAA